MAVSSGVLGFSVEVYVDTPETRSTKEAAHVRLHVPRHSLSRAAVNGLLHKLSPTGSAVLLESLANQDRWKLTLDDQRIFHGIPRIERAVWLVNKVMRLAVMAVANNLLTEWL